MKNILALTLVLGSLGWFAGCDDDSGGSNGSDGGAQGGSSGAQGNSGGKGGSASGAGGAFGNTGGISPIGGASGTVTVACTITGSMACIEYTNVPAASAAIEMGCRQGGGTVSTGCSRTGLTGVCTIAVAGTAAARTYYYVAGQASAFQMACTQGGGTWSTTP